MDAQTNWQPPKTNRAERWEEIKKAKAQWKQDALERIPIDGTFFGQGKNFYRLNYIRARTVKTADTWIRSIVLVINLLILSKSFMPWKGTQQSSVFGDIFQTNSCLCCRISNWLDWKAGNHPEQEWPFEEIHFSTWTDSVWKIINVCSCICWAVVSLSKHTLQWRRGIKLLVNWQSFNTITGSRPIYKSLSR